MDSTPAALSSVALALTCVPCLTLPHFALPSRSPPSPACCPPQNHTGLSNRSGLFTIAPFFRPPPQIHRPADDQPFPMFAVGQASSASVPDSTGLKVFLGVATSLSGAPGPGPGAPPPSSRHICQGRNSYSLAPHGGACRDGAKIWRRDARRRRWNTTAITASWERVRSATFAYADSIAPRPSRRLGLSRDSPSIPRFGAFARS